MLSSSRVLAALLFAFHGVLAQQLPGYTVPYNELGLSSACFDAVNSTVSACPAWLPAFAGFEDSSFDLLGASRLKDLCDTTCQADLTSLKKRIASACTDKTDVMVPNDIAYPASLFIDRLLYAASLSCLKDSDSGEYCDLLVASWISQNTPYTKAQNCSSCQLEIQAKQLGSPFGYDEEAASQYASSTSSCAVTKYTYAKPTSYAVNSTTAVPDGPACSTGRAYTVKGGDSCNSIAESQGVSTPALTTLNGIDSECNTMPPVGSEICLPPPCKIHQVEIGDTCDSIIDAEKMTKAQLLAWNPAISPGCGNLGRLRGRFICLSSPLGTITVPDGDSATTEAPKPTNAQGESNVHCGKWYEVVEGDTCATISLAFAITLADFYFLNPHVDKKNCNNLWLETSYCVKAVGNIQTYPDYPIEVPSTSFPRPPEPTKEVPPEFDMPELNPRAPGTIGNCDEYVSAWSEQILATDSTANSCDRWANWADVRVVQLRRWNPSLRENDCAFQELYSYCVLKRDDMDGQST
ncbi:LysM domain-containing protein [Stachybotrys elegans]|uniref:LysM domain-containing protein n=1 Tax=Stachybotrys elegans TaxID=80388 RepID=A0A8K0WQC1_9HYPO|nr:LysM domain-containing protein [Stachybotrys elegans]